MEQKKFVTPEELSQRWEGRISPRTLANWRSQGNGPPFVKVGGRILYPHDKLLEWEGRNTVSSTSQYRGAAA